MHMSRQVTLPPCSDELPNELTEGSVVGLQPIGALGAGGRQTAEQARPAAAGPMTAEDAEETYNKISDWTP